MIDAENPNPMTPRLTKAQSELLELLPQWVGCRWHTGHIERTLKIDGRKFMPATFNALVDANLAWGHDPLEGGIRVGRLNLGETTP
jgi:hypothetical protein